MGWSTTGRRDNLSKVEKTKAAAITAEYGYTPIPTPIREVEKLLFDSFVVAGTRQERPEAYSGARIGPFA